MAERVLVTGGLGFIGRHVVGELLQRGKSVRIFDNLNEQVHGTEPPPTPRGAEAVVGDLRDPTAVFDALSGVDAVVHLAAEVGVGQSMYQIQDYVGANELGTAVLTQQLIERPVRRIVTASSMSIYGEGLYRDASGALAQNVHRHGFTAPQPLDWDPVGENGEALDPVPTPEWKAPSLNSVYALTKYAQERLTLIAPPAYGMQAVALRLFNVYGPGQALSNPYTGVLAIFAARILNDRPPLIFEDGGQRRDFVHVSDVARAFAEALDHPNAPGQVYNVGSGGDVSIEQVARQMLSAMGRDDLQPEITNRGRTGDVRHCFADIAKARKEIDFEPRVRLQDALPRLAEWLAGQTAEDRVEQARGELEARGLVT